MAYRTHVANEVLNEGNLYISKIGNTPFETIFSTPQNLSVASVVRSPEGWALQFLDLPKYLSSSGRVDQRRIERIHKMFVFEADPVLECIAEIHVANNIYSVFPGAAEYAGARLRDCMEAMKQIQHAILPPPPPPEHIQFHFPSSEDDELPPLTPLSGISSSDDENF